MRNKLRRIINLSKQNAVAIYLLTLIAWLSVRTDGYFPFSADSSEGTKVFWATLQVGLVIVGLIVSLWVQRDHKKTEDAQTFAQLQVSLFIAGEIITFTVLQYKNIHIYSEQIGHTNTSMLLLISGLTLAVTLYTLYRFRNKPQLLAIGSLCNSSILALLSIYLFPLTAKLADLMPIIREQGSAFLRGEGIYQYFLLDNGVSTQAVRQPGMMVAYLPGVILNFDIRIMNLVFLGIVALVVYKWLREKELSTSQFAVAWLLFSTFLFWPYRLVRTDMYDPPFWAILLVMVYMLQHRKKLWAAILVGLGIFVQVWMWLFTPFIYVYAYHRYGLRSAVKFALVSLAIGGGLLALFILPDPAAYFEHAFGFYSDYSAGGLWVDTSIHLTPLVHYIGLGEILKYIQFGATALVGLLALIWQKTFARLVVLLAIAFLVFIQFNSISWNYFYFTFVLLLLILLLNWQFPSSVNTENKLGVA